MQIQLQEGGHTSSVLRAIQSLPGGASAFANGVRVVSAESRRAVRFQATALWIVTAIVLLGAAILLVQLVGRSVQQPEDDARRSPPWDSRRADPRGSSARSGRWHVCSSRFPSR